jgi:hypothetical protein
MRASRGRERERACERVSELARSLAKNLKSSSSRSLARVSFHQYFALWNEDSGKLFCCFVYCIFCFIPIAILVGAIQSGDQKLFEDGFEIGGPLDHDANICAGRMKYTATGSGALT